MFNVSVLSASSFQIELGIFSRTRISSRLPGSRAPPPARFAGIWSGGEGKGGLWEQEGGFMGVNGVVFLILNWGLAFLIGLLFLGVGIDRGIGV